MHRTPTTQAPIASATAGHLEVKSTGRPQFGGDAHLLFRLIDVDLAAAEPLLHPGCG
jgi:hypothetical protein